MIVVARRNATSTRIRRFRAACAAEAWRRTVEAETELALFQILALREIAFMSILSNAPR